MARRYIPVALRRQVAEDSGYRCGYCHHPQLYTGIQLVPDHIIPDSLGGKTVRDNLWMSCRRCNEHKGARTVADDPLTQEEVSLYNPRSQRWKEHFVWSDDGTVIIGKTNIGRATVAALNMNAPAVMKARRFWTIAGWHPPHG